ncbi:MAG: glycosyltransferase, partial [Acidobacteriota bacterium]
MRSRDADGAGSHCGRSDAAGSRNPCCWHILLVTDVYPPGCGGSGWSTHALALALKEYGHQVEVISVEPSLSGLSQRTWEGIRVTGVGVRRARRNPFCRLAARDYSYRILASYLGKRLDRHPEVDIVHAQHLHSGPPALAAARSRARG